MLDLALSARLIELCAIAHDDRDDAWSEAFFDAVWNAAVQVGTPQEFRGPDGFTYVRLNLPVAGQRFAASSLAGIAMTCIEGATGVALFAGPTATEPAYVMSMGLLDCMVRHDSWRGDPIDLAELAAAQPSAKIRVRREADGREALEIADSHEVLLGAPSAAFLPPYTARALRRHLTELWQMADPRVSVMVDTAVTPSRSLMISRSPRDFADPGAHCHGLLWYLPPGRTVLLRPESVSEAAMTKLSTLCGA